MKRFFIMMFAMLSVCMTAMAQNVEVLYFHGKQRCKTCMAIEKETKYHCAGTERQGKIERYRHFHSERQETGSEIQGLLVVALHCVRQRKERESREHDPLCLLQCTEKRRRIP